MTPAYHQGGQSPGRSVALGLLTLHPQLEPLGNSSLTLGAELPTQKAHIFL